MGVLLSLPPRSHARGSVSGRPSKSMGNDRR